MVAHAERRPADAYYEIARWVDKVDGGYFFRPPPPKERTELTIIGKDAVPTTWVFNHLTASRCHDFVHGQRDLAVVERRRFDAQGDMDTHWVATWWTPAA